jgi:hypothetical protein
MTHPQEETTEVPRRSKVLALLAIVACAGCCALPVLVPLGVLTTAGVAAATTGLLVVAAVLFVLAGVLWFAHRRLTHRRAHVGHGCVEGECGC